MHQPGHEASHLVMRMADPLREDGAVRGDVNKLLRAGSHQDVDEVRNTIFPAALAEVFTDPAELVNEYLDDYEVLKGLGSKQGTYFGRICRYPHPNGTVTAQLENLIGKLNEAQHGTRWRAIYQLNIYAEHLDKKKKRGFFPCMAHLGFQLALGADGHADHLDCLAFYRYQDMILKGYGNLLGLAELQRYVAEATGFRPGELTVVAGHAMMTLGGSTRPHLKQLLDA
jgi:thymidylate synthase